MIEIDPGIMDSEELIRRVKISALKKEIPKRFFGFETESSRDYEKQILIDISANLHKLKRSYAIVERPITSNRPIIGKIIVFVKKVYRKMTRWIFASYYQQQNQINETVMQTLSGMVELQELMLTKYQKEDKGESNAD